MDWVALGKTQLAIEYVYRFATNYDLVWWLPAEGAALIAEAFSRLAPHLGLDLADLTDPLPMIREALRRGHPYSNWLLVFDNADSPRDVGRFLTIGTGHVLITSRDVSWRSTAETIIIDVFRPEESAALLHSRVRGLTDAEALGVADAVGHLPLAVEQAAACLGETGMTATMYMGFLETNLLRLMESRSA